MQNNKRKYSDSEKQENSQIHRSLEETIRKQLALLEKQIHTTNIEWLQLSSLNDKVPTRTDKPKETKDATDTRKNEEDLADSINNIPIRMDDLMNFDDLEKK